MTAEALIKSFRRESVPGDFMALLVNRWQVFPKGPGVSFKWNFHSCKALKVTFADAIVRLSTAASSVTFLFPVCLILFENSFFFFFKLQKLHCVSSEIKGKHWMQNEDGKKSNIDIYELQLLVMQCWSKSSQLSKKYMYVAVQWNCLVVLLLLPPGVPPTVLHKETSVWGPGTNSLSAINHRETAKLM